MKTTPPPPLRLIKRSLSFLLLGKGCSGVQAVFAQEPNVTVVDLELYRVYNKTLPKFT